jgi:PAS domain S-box-containing protein
MNPGVACAFLLCAVSLWLRRPGSASRAAHRTARGLALVVLAFATSALACVLLGYGGGPDQWLFASRLNGNRIAPNTGACLALLSAAVLLLDVRGWRWLRPSPHLAMTSVTIAAIALVGYAYRIFAFYGVGQFIPMALNTALAIVALSAAVLAARPEARPIATWFSDWRLEKAIASGFTAALLMLCLIGLVSYDGTCTLIALNRMDTEDMRKVIALGDLLSTVKDAETGQRGYLLTGDEHYLEPYDAARRRLRVELDRLSGLAAESDSNRRAVGQLDALVSAKLDLIDRTIRLRRSGDADGARAVVLAGDGQRLMNDLRAAVARMTNAERYSLHRREAVEQRAGRQIVWTVVFGATVAFVLVGSAVVVVRRGTAGRRAAERVVGESEERYRSLVSASSEIVWTADPVGKRRRPSPAWLAFTGQTEAEASDDGWYDAVHPDDVEAVRAAWRWAASAAVPFDVEFRVRRTGGTYRLVASRGVPLLGADGAVREWVGTCADVTEARQAEAERQRAMEAAEAASRSKSEFLANMSHEIRTPMTAIMGYADMLLDPALSASDRLDAISTVRRQSEHLLTIINDVLDLSKIEAGRMDLERLACDPCRVAGEVVSLMRVRSIERGIRLDLQFQGRVPRTVRTDPTRLRQILVNLVGNAVKFTATGGVQLVLSVTDRGGEALLRFDVIDTGIGMTAEQVGELFRPFQQGDTSTTRQFGGTGLGLTIARRLARLLGGDIDVQSLPGLGSRFGLTIPAGDLVAADFRDGFESVAPEAAARPAAERSVALRGRVLLADDGANNQRVISYYLRKAGLDVETADNGRVACRMALDALEAGRPFDVVLMDMQMPEMDGYTAAARLRGKGYAGPIVALTAHAMAHDRDKCLQSGCSDYLSKPIDRDLLVSTLAAAIGQQRDVAPPAPAPAADDPTGEEPDDELRQFLPMFVAQLPGQVGQMQAALADGDLDLLGEVVHQLKGSGGMYGYPDITAAATGVERRMDAMESLEAIEAEVRSLIELVRQVDGVPVGGAPRPEREATTERQSQ